MIRNRDKRHAGGVPAKAERTATTEAGSLRMAYMINEVKIVNICPVFLTNTIIKTIAYYVEKLGFKYAKHFNKNDNFAAIYRDSIEIIIAQKRKGQIESNKEKHGNDYNAPVGGIKLKHV